MKTEADQQSEFEQRAGALLRQSADDLDGATRSRLTQSRHRALDQRTRPGAFGAWRSWAPTGAVALAVLVTLGYVSQVGRNGLGGGNGGGEPAQMAATSSADGTSAGATAGATDNTGEYDDLALLADSEALELSQDEDLDFYEWAAGSSSPAVGT